MLGRWRRITESEERRNNCRIWVGSLWNRRTLGGILENKQHPDVRIMASGGNMDWAPEYARSNTRAEQTHILAAMIQLFETGINVLYSVDYTGAINNFNECGRWTDPMDDM